MTRPGKEKAAVLKVLVAALAVGVLVLSLLPLFEIGPATRVPIHVSPFLADSAKTMALAIQNSLSKSAGIIDRTSPAAAIIDKVLPVLSPQPLAGSRLPAAGAGAPGEAGNALFLLEGKDVIKLEGVRDGEGRSMTVGAGVVTFRYFYLAADGEKSVAGIPVRELWAWESAPYVNYEDVARIEDVTLRNNFVTALAARGMAFAVSLSSQAPTSFFRLSAGMPWISPDPTHIPATAQAEKVVDLNKRNDMTAVYSVSPNTSAAFTHAHAVPASAPAEGDFPSGLEIALTPGEGGGRRATLRLVTVAQGHFNGILSHEQSLDVPLPQH